jgi:hypothetical protein
LSIVADGKAVLRVIVAAPEDMVAEGFHDETFE